MRKLFFLLIIAPIIAFSQSTYYIDATNGNDNNNGLSVSTPWKTISKVNNQTFNAGDQILFKRNEIWNGERLYIENITGSTANNVTYSDYGNGEKPIISSIINQSHNWSYTSNNIWKATNPPAEHPERLLINLEEKLRANIMSELDGVNYFWFYNDNTNELFIHSNDDPINTIISYSTDFPLIISDSENITLNNIDFQGGWTAIYITSGTNNVHLNNLNIGKHSREGIIISTDASSPTEYPKNINIDNCNFDAFFNFDYSSAGTYQDSFDRGCSDGIRTEVLINGEINNCYFKNWGHASINIDGIHVSNIKISNNFLTSPDICYGGRIAVDDATNIEVYNNEIINTSVQSQLNGQSNHYHHNIFSDTKDTSLILDVIDAGIELQGYSNTDVIDNIFENNIILNTEGPAIRISGNNDFDIYNNTFRNNIIYNCGITTNGKSIVIEENEFGTSHNNIFKNNLIHNTNTTQTCDFRSNITDVQLFNTVSDDGYQIDNNISENPLLVDIINNDYHLTANSSCINSGITTLSTSDFEGNQVPYNSTNPDIGIYESQYTLNIKNYDNGNEIVIFPNPTNGIINFYNIDLNEIRKIKISDIHGKIISETTITNKPLLNTELNNGIYFIEITTTDNRTSIKKIILK